MPNSSQPRIFHGVMVSSTFTDLKEHRAALTKIIESHGFKSIVMEHDSAKPGVDVIESSLGMVRDAAAYVGVISQKYGQVPAAADRNPHHLSITELEFDRAVELGRPILLFIMGEDHPGKKSDFESDPAKLAKLDAFRERAKKIRPDSQVHRVYATFENLEEFKEKAAKSVADLREYFNTLGGLQNLDDTDTGTDRRIGNAPIPSPPAFYAEPPYIGSHAFVGRRDQLEVLSEWASPADQHPALLYEAIGGSGKSILTWEWVRNYALKVRQDWAGLVWYSFYERGAIMADFCQHALAYMTGQPLKELKRKKTTELAPLLLRELQARPWLMVLDGLERVLVAYHRIDAAQLRDEEAGEKDVIAQRDPCTAIRPDDDDLLRLLSTATPSKLIITSRLTPRVLLNASNQEIPGVLRKPLPGLRPVDAEEMFRACGVSGDSAEIQAYLKTHCDCHPLTVGALAGLVTHYRPARGDFDKWRAAPAGGGSLDFASLDLVQKRNHILNASISALSEDSRRVLSVIALLSEAVPYETLQSTNPMVSRTNAKPDSECSPSAQQRLDHAIDDLEKRGLLQYDAGHYDLHPVVRGVATSRLGIEDKRTLGQPVVDHFSAQSHDPYELAETLADLRDGLRLVRVLLQMGRFQEASGVYRGPLAQALNYNLEAHAEKLALLKPFFARGWNSLPDGVTRESASYLANDAFGALHYTGQYVDAAAGRGRLLLSSLAAKDWTLTCLHLCWLAVTFRDINKEAKDDLCTAGCLEVAASINDAEELFRARLFRFNTLVAFGRWEEADSLWRALDPMGRNWRRAVYRSGDAERDFAWARFLRGDITEEDLVRAERLTQAGRTRLGIRSLHELRGDWGLERHQWSTAAEHLHEALAMGRSVGRRQPKIEAALLLAKFHLGQLHDPRAELGRFSSGQSGPASLYIAKLWFELGDLEHARSHALAGYTWAWADGEPYVRRYYLEKFRALLDQLGAEIPALPRYDHTKDEKLPWEAPLAAAIETLSKKKSDLA